MRRLHKGLPAHTLLVLDAAYCEYVRRNDYEAGLELVATTDNTVMTRTFSKIYGLAALRLGWAYCPAGVADVLNRVRGPFNVTAPALAAGVAALADRAHLETAVAHNDTWLPWVTAEIEKLGLQGDAERRQFRPDPLPDREGPGCRQRRRAAEVARHHPAPGRRLRPAQLPAHDDRHRGATTAPWWRRSPSSWGADDMTTPMFERVALIGIGLIGSSLSHAMRRGGLARTIVGHAQREKTRETALRLGLVSSAYATAAEAVRGADLVILCAPVGAYGAIAKEMGPSLQPGAIVTDVGSVKGAVRARRRPVRAEGRAFHSRATRSPAPSIPAPRPASPSCSTAAGAC